MIIGHQKQIKFLREAIENKKTSQAYLFTGPEGVGKFLVAEYFSEKLISNSKSRINPDLIIVKPEKIKKGKLIKEKKIDVETIRESQKELSFYPHSGKCKVLVVDDAHKLTLSAQNALLKSIEEPNGTSVIILISGRDEEILPTVKSRCQRINFNLVHTGLIREKIVQANSREISFFSMGRPGLAVKMKEDNDFFESKKKDFEEFRKFFSMNINERIDLAEKGAKNNTQLFEKLEFWTWILRFQIYRNLENRRKVKSFAEAIKKINKTIEILKTTNANTRLVLENLLIEL